MALDFLAVCSGTKKRREGRMLFHSHVNPFIWFSGDGSDR
ncbi:hypothetical protein SAMN05216233_109161 [Desulfoluna spongiiphila]|uniref:Uncharacterized protein n=1 Tax=Desulfoluna spongiiphila TaxID=419481 RepID=A0A1G5G2R6_9BACT|nr:hypothetical protein SAMN05216233_109161 [Desulfoluna spongiiphila]